MKKAISVFLTALMILTLFSCSGQNAGSTPQASPSASQSVAPASPSAEASSVSSSTASVSASAATSTQPSASQAGVSADLQKIGFFSDGVDPQSRKTYKIAFIQNMTLLLYQKIAECINNYSEQLNFSKLIESDAQSDMDKFIQFIQTQAGQGVDGFVIAMDPTAATRIIEVLDETKIPYMNLFNSILDSDGHNLIPTVGLDQKEAGATTMQWLCDNYKTYWGDIDTSKLGLIDFTLSVAPDLNDRANGAKEIYKELIKNDNVYMADTVSAGVTEQAGYDLAAATAAAHPEIKYWFIACCLEQYAQGAARAIETLNLDKNTLIVDVGSDILTSEWDTNYNGCWKACLAISNYLYATPLICGLIAMIDGKATPDSLWADQKHPGDKAAVYRTANEMITKDTYKEYFNKYAQMAGAPLPYTK